MPSLASLAIASAPAAAGGSSIVGEIIGILLPLALIVAALLAVLYVMRRRFGLSRGDAPLSILQVLPVGPRDRIVVVKSRGGRVFAVGVGTQSVTFITNLDPADVAPVTGDADGAQAAARSDIPPSR